MTSECEDAIHEAMLKTKQAKDMVLEVGIEGRQNDPMASLAVSLNRSMHWLEWSAHWAKVAGMDPVDREDTGREL